MMKKKQRKRFVWTILLRLFARVCVVVWTILLCSLQDRHIGST